MIAVATASLAQTSFISPSIPLAIGSSNPALGDERHLQATPMGALCANSAFAHGYRHGYDQGFHLGDLNLQMGRDPASFGKLRANRPATEYRDFFGSKQLFEMGYEAGLRGGYSDAVAGFEYRGRERIEAAALGLSTDVLPASRRPHFDEGFASGYASSQSQKAPSQS